MFTLPYLINDQMQLLIAILRADKYFWKSEFGFWIFKISRSRQKPGENREHGWVNIPVPGLKVKTGIWETHYKKKTQKGL